MPIQLLAPSNGTATSECQPIFDQDPWLLEGTTIATLIMSAFSIAMLAIVFVSFAAFPSLRRSACNWMILYASIVCAFGTADIVAMALYTLGKWRVMESGVWCDIAGFILQLYYMNHNGTSLFYVSMLITSKKGNGPAMWWGRVMMAFNTFLFVALGVTAWVMVGFQPLCHIPICWIAGDSSTSDSVLLLQFAFLYLWAGLPGIASLVVLAYILYDSWHSRTNGLFRMVLQRGAYALLQVFDWCVFATIDVEAASYVDSPATGWVYYLSGSIRAGIPGLQILIFLLTEKVWQRWQIRRRGVAEERKEEIRRSLIVTRHTDVDPLVEERLTSEQRDPQVQMMIHVALEGMSSSDTSFSSSLQTGTSLYGAIWESADQTG